MAEFDFSNIDFSPFIRSAYLEKSVRELTQKASTDKFAAYELAQRFVRHGDNANALKYYKMAEQLGDNGALFEIAMILHEMKQFKEAATYFEKTIEQTGHLDAYVHLARYCLLGQISLFKQKKRAHNLLLSAAEKGCAEAQFLVALTYRDGVGTSKNIAEYVLWMRCAQRNGFSKAIEHIRVRMSDSRYTHAWEGMIKQADTRLNQHDEYFAYERLVKEMLISED